MSDETQVQETVSVTDAAEKRAKRLEKDFQSKPGSVVITVYGGTKGSVEFNPGDLPIDIQNKLVPFGLGHKLGDAAAGRSGADAEEAIQKVWDGLKNADWTVRAPAAPKLSLKDISANYANLSDDEKEQARTLCAALGIKLPGITA
jgi:hypothetical protein